MTVVRPKVRGLRGRLLLSVLGAIAVVLGALTLAFNLVLAARLNADATGVVQARASAELASLRVSHGQILLPEALDERNPDRQIWVFQGLRALERPQSTQVNDAAAAVLARRAPASSDVPRTSSRLYALDVVQSGRRLGAVVAAVSLAPYDQTRRTALVASAVLALAILIAVAIAAQWLIGRALRPVARMTRQASEWSEHDLDRRFSLGPVNDEFTQLAATLDGLLDRLAASLGHEQRLSAELSHELRTPLASIVAETQYALKHSPQTDEGKAILEQILQSARQLGRTLDTLIAAARAQLDPRRATSDATAAAHAATAWIAREAARELTIEVTSPSDPVRVAVEQDLVERMLAPLLENAARHADEWVQVSIERDGQEVRFAVSDDGPGVPSEEHEAIFEPGRRLERPASGATITSRGAGLGLALSRRLARAAGGDVHCEPSETGGRFVVRLPTA
jgi:signal transduction histidine kinase